MHKTLGIKTLLTVCVAVLLFAAPSFAAVAWVDFEWSQSDPDPATGSGTLSTTIAGVNFTGTMPVPTLNQYETLNAGATLPAGFVGFTTASEDNTGKPFGFHLGWSGFVTLTGFLDPNGANIEYKLDVDLSYDDDDLFSWEADIYDDVSPLLDLVGTVKPVAFIGNDQSGSKRDGDDIAMAAGPDMAFQAKSGTNTNNANGDDVGIRLGVRDWTDPNGNIDDGEPLPGPLYFSNVIFGGSLKQDVAGAVLVSDGVTKLVPSGDVNFDFIVDLANDFEAVRANFLQSVAIGENGDHNNDEFIDFADFEIFKSNHPFPLSAITTSVPEPSTAVLLMLATAVCSLRRRLFPV